MDAQHDATGAGPFDLGFGQLLDRRGDDADDPPDTTLSAVIGTATEAAPADNRNIPVVTSTT